MFQDILSFPKYRCSTLTFFVLCAKSFSHNLAHTLTARTSQLKFGVMSQVRNLDSEVKILKTKAAAKKGLRAAPSETETIWPKPEFVC